MTSVPNSYYCMNCTLYKRRVKDTEDKCNSKRLKCRKCKRITSHIPSQGKIQISTLEFDF